ncbi:hypothetical protein BDAP_001666 [Binucleata daphniae]
MFTATSLVHLRSMSNYCGKAALRRIDVDIYEIYFCGRKMCFDNDTFEIKGCIGNEHNDKWDLQKVDKIGLYLIRIDDYCVSLKYGKVYMDLCDEGVDLSQAVRIIQETKLPKFAVSDDFGADMRKKKFETKIYDNEMLYRNLSIYEGSEFAQGSRHWNINLEQHGIK